MVTLVSQGASAVIQMASTVILARLLRPEDYGVLAMVMAVTAFAGLFRDLGLSSAAIQKHTLTNAQQSNLFWVNVAFGATLTVALVAASPLVAWFYQKPEVLWVTVALSANCLVSSLATQSGALLVREMRFGRQAAAPICGALIGLLVSVVLALKGYRYWSLVWGQLTGGVISAIMLFILSPFRPGLPSRGTGLREMLKFGAHITAFDFVNYFHRNLDNVLIGRFWGGAALGMYSRAYSLLMFPIINLRGPIHAVAFPAMSRLQDQPGAFRNYYRQITSLLAFLSMPLTAFLFVSSSAIIDVALGKQWSGVAPIFAVLAVVGFIQPAVTNWGIVLLSLGQPKRFLRVGMWNAVFSVAGFVGGLPWGAIGVATGYAVVTYLSLWPILRMSFKGSALRVSDFFESIAAPAIASCVAASVLILAGGFFKGQLAFVQVLLMGSVFVSLYALCFCLIPGGRSKLLAHMRLIPSIIPRTNGRLGP